MSTAELSFRNCNTESISECSKDDADDAFSRVLGGIQVNTEKDIVDKIEHELIRGEKNDVIQSLVAWTDSFNTTLLWYAARNGYVRVIQILLGNGCDFTVSRGQNGTRLNLEEASKVSSTPLIAAIAYFNYEAAQELLGHYRRCDISISPEEAGSALLVLASNCKDLCDDSLQSNIANILIELVGADINREIKVEYAGEKLPLLSHAAKMKNRENLVRKLLNVEFVVNRPNALYRAASAGNSSTVKLFISENFRQNVESARSASARHIISLSDMCYAAILACESETNMAIETIGVLLAQGASLGHKTIFGETAVSSATSKSNIELLEFILENGGDPMEGFDSIVNDEGSLESRACLSILLKYLHKQLEIEGHSWINSKRNGMPVLTLVSMRCSRAFVEIVLEQGADVNLVDDEKCHTPLNWACSMDNVSAVQALLAAGADPNACNDRDQFTSLHTAVACGSKELVELLLVNGADPNMKTRLLGSTSLHLAVDRGSKTIVKTLLTVGNVQIDQVDHDGTTSLSDAVVKACSEHHHELIEIVELLLDANASPDVKDLRGNTALISAAGGRNIELVRRLVKSGADLEAVNEDKDSPLGLVAGNLDDVICMKILKLMFDHEMRLKDNSKMDGFLREKTKRLLNEGKVQIIASLAVPMLQSVDTRKVITDSPELWECKNVPSRRCINRDGSSYPNRKTNPENMLTWAIINNSPAVQVLLKSVDEEMRLPFNWRSSLVVEETKAGTPIRIAVDKKNISAISTMLGILESMWDYKYSSHSKQRNPHPLDNLQYQDLTSVIEMYPRLMMRFLKEVNLVPTYSFVAGLSHAPIARHDIWVLLSNERSPTALWEQHVKKLLQLRNWSTHDDDDQKVSETNDREEEHMLTWSYSLIDRICMVSLASFSEKDVKSYMVPIKGIASYEILLACVKVSDELRSSVLFESPIVVAVVELHWRLYGLRNHIFNLSLFLVLVGVFLVLSICFDDWADAGMAMQSIAWILQVVKLSLSLYFVVWQELNQMRHGGQMSSLRDYFTSVWNVIDLSLHGLIFLGFILEARDTNSVAADGVHGVAALLLWFKLLDFVRPFRHFGPTINMIFGVSADIRGFVIVLLVVMIGFGSAFSIMLNGVSTKVDCDSVDITLQNYCVMTYGSATAFNTVYHTLRSSFAYMLTAYDFGDIDYGPIPVLLTVIWALFMFAVSIILFNLLIAIISESYVRITSTKIPSWRLEQANVVVSIFSMLSIKEKNRVHDYILCNPWLQVLAPKASTESLKNYAETLKSVQMHDKFKDLIEELGSLTKSIEKHEWRHSTLEKLECIDQALKSVERL